MKKGKGSVNRFTKDGVSYYPGDIVDLPARYKGYAWLERVKPEPKVEVPPAKVMPVEEEKPRPLEAPKTPKKKKGK